MRVTLIGCGDAFSTKGRNQAATLVETGGVDLLIDCGATTLAALQARDYDMDRLAAVILTHLHGDHFGGLPFLLLSLQWTKRRTTPFTIVGPTGTRARLLALMDVLYPDTVTRTPWTFDWPVIDVEPGDSLVVAGATITTALVDHPSGAPSSAVRITHDGRSVVHSGDTRWVDTLPDIARGADLFLVECYGFDRPLPMHLDYRTLERHRAAFDAKRVVLVHMGPAMLANLKHVDRTAFDIGGDGRVFEL